MQYAPCSPSLYYPRSLIHDKNSHEPTSDHKVRHLTQITDKVPPHHRATDIINVPKTENKVDYSSPDSSI